MVTNNIIKVIIKANGSKAVTEKSNAKGHDNIIKIMAPRAIARARARPI